MGFLNSWLTLFDSKSRSRSRVDGSESAIEPLLHSRSTEAASVKFEPEEVTRVALRLRYLVEQVVPCELEEWKITKANSPIITRKVVKAAQQAGGPEYAPCVLFCLLICRTWFHQQALHELWDESLYSARKVACEVIAKQIIETEDREDYLMEENLLRRYSILVHGQPTEPANVIEKAVDVHALRVIGTSGYQKCIRYLWWGWLVQDDIDPSSFVPYKHRANTDYWIHFDPDRMRAPQYQNWVQMSISVIYLALYTGAINTINHTGDLDVVEAILYVMTAGFVFDELTKLWKVGKYYIGFWNVFNSTLYMLLVVSFILRLIALSNDVDTHERHRFNELSYNFLAFSAPMFWMRLLLYLDSFKFFGAMLVVLKVMMKESLIFFALLVVICIGFLQGFIGLDTVDDNQTVTSFILASMANSVMQSPDFSGFENFAHPFGLILYYIYTFVVMVVLLNILIALYNSAYSNVTDQSDDEYMALFASKTMQFVRAPDENVFIAPLNLIEVFLLVLPLEWWLPAYTYERLNNVVMAIIYSPLLLVTAALEQRNAYRIQTARRRGDDDEDRVEVWEQQLRANNNNRNSSNGSGDNNNNANSSSWTLPDADPSWARAVATAKPDVATDAAVLEVRQLKGRISELVRAVEALQKQVEQQQQPQQQS